MPAHQITWARTAVILTGIFACTLVVIALSERDAAEKRVGQTVTVWEREFAAAFANEDWLFIRKLAVNLRSQGVSHLSLRMQGEEVFESPMQPGHNTCLLPVTRPIQRYGVQMGELRACLSPRSLLQTALFNRWLLPLTLLLAAAIGLAAAYPLWHYKRSLTETLRVLRGWAVQRAGSIDQMATDDALVQDLIHLVRGGVQHEVSSQSERAKKQSLDELAQLAAQVAHDVRSPLAALDVVSSQAASLAEDTRVLLQMATTRIQAIADQLLSKYDETQSLARADEADSSPSAWVLHTVQQMVNEKRALDADKAQQLKLSVGEAVYGAFAGMPTTALAQTLSNLLNNALEAIGPAGQVQLEVDATDTHVQVLVLDDGAGIPPELLAKLGTQPGLTAGKEAGHGLGVYHARCAARAAGGDLILRSTVGSGTEITLLLPRVAPPAWFAATLDVPPNASVVVADDDASIHAIWRSRLAERTDITLHHVHTLQALRSWRAAHDTRNTLFLVDHDFRSETDSGLDIIQALNLAPQAVLVTSRADTVALQLRCARLQLRLISKAVVAWVPIPAP